MIILKQDKNKIPGIYNANRRWKYNEPETK